MPLFVEARLITTAIVRDIARFFALNDSTLPVCTCDPEVFRLYIMLSIILLLLCIRNFA